MDQYGKKRTYGIYLLVLANIVGFAVELYYTNLYGPEFLEIYMLSYSNLVEGNYISIISHAFLHAGPAHLASNMLGLYLFGKPFERSVGTLKTFLTYISTSVAGALVTIAILPETNLIGASGAVFGIMAGAMLLDPGESLMEQVPIIRWLSFPLVRNLFSVVFFATIYFLANAMNVFNFSDGIAYSAHIGGFLAGGVLTYYWKPDRAALGLKIFIPFLALIAAVGYLQPGTQYYWYAVGGLLFLLVVVRAVSARSEGLRF